MGGHAMTEEDDRFERALAIFREREPHLIADHVACFASPEIANSLLVDPRKLERTEVIKLFNQYARDRGYFAAFELGWHWLARNEQELCDWQMAYLEKVGDSLGDRNSYLALNKNTREKLGYRFRFS